MLMNPKSQNSIPGPVGRSWRRVLASLAFLALSVLVPIGALAQEFSVRGAISGNWYDPAQDGHGVQIEVVNETQAVVAWYTYDSEGSLVWLFGVGEVDGDQIHVTFEIFSGGKFPPAFDPAMVETRVWGEATLTFSDCDTAIMTWSTTEAGYSSGSMSLTRLTAIEGQACGSAETFETVVEMNMDAGAGMWQPVFVDYSIGAQILASADWTILPGAHAHLDGWLLAGTNVSGALGAFLKTSVGGLKPNTEYFVEMDMQFATNAPRGCSGIGVVAGEEVYVKLGASDVEPVAVEVNGGIEFNVDKGFGASGGAEAMVAGNITNRQDGCPPQKEWQIKTVSTAGTNFTARTDAEGNLWLFCGTDSTVQGRSEIYVTAFTARMTPAE